MGGHQLPKARREGLITVSSFTPPPSSSYRRGLLFACGCLYLVLTFFGAIRWPFGRYTAIDDALRFPVENMAPKKLLAVVVPTHAGDLKDAVLALSRWPNVCSAITLHRMQLVIYYAANTGDGVWSEEIIPTVAQTAGRCFQRTRVIFADLDKEVMGSNASFAVPLASIVFMMGLQVHCSPSLVSVCLRQDSRL